MTKVAQMSPPYSIEIIDISSYQDYDAHGNYVGIDFQRVKDTRPSLKGIIVKCGEGLIDYTMDAFLTQAREARSFGFGVLPYHFWRYAADDIEQAQYFVDRVSKLDFIPARYVVDVEDDNPACKPPDHVLAQWEYQEWIEKAVTIMRRLKKYCFAIKSLTGSLPIFYTGDWWFGWIVKLARMGTGHWYEDLSWLKEIDFWFASYTSPVMCITDEIDSLQVCMWQWTSTPPTRFQVNGFPWKERLDLNFWLWPESEFYTTFGLKAPTVEPSTGGAVIPSSDWEKAFDAWARGIGYDGPKPGG